MIMNVTPFNDSSMIVQQNDPQVITTDNHVDTVIIKEEQTNGNVGTSRDWGASDLGGWLGLFAALCLGVFFWRIISSLKAENKRIKGQLSQLENKVNDSLNQLNEKVESMSGSLDLQYREIKDMKKSHSPVRGSNTVSQPKQEVKAEKTEKIAKNTKETTVIRYATLQAPDENGVLRFSERSMTDTPSPQKLFLLEINPEVGTGVYRINPIAVSVIMSDLQMLKDFVKPFTFSGDIANATIEDKTVGRISKQGALWVVDDPLEIKFV